MPGVLATLITGQVKLLIHAESALALVLGQVLAQPEARGSKEEPCADLERVYGAISQATGLSIARAGQAAALLRQLGLLPLARRFSRLSSRRRAAAHPDACFLAELGRALAELDESFVQRVADAFSSAQGQHVEGDTEAQCGAQQPAARVPPVPSPTPPISGRSDEGGESTCSEAAADARLGFAISERSSEGGVAKGEGARGRSAWQRALPTTTVAADDGASAAAGGAGAVGGAGHDGGGKRGVVPEFPFAQDEWDSFYIGTPVADVAVQTSCAGDNGKDEGKERKGGLAERRGAQQLVARVPPASPATPPISGRSDDGSESLGCEAMADARREFARAERCEEGGGGLGGGASEGSAMQRAGPATTVPAAGVWDDGAVFKQFCHSLNEILSKERVQTSKGKAELVSEIEALASCSHTQIYEVCVKGGNGEKGKQSERGSIRFWHRKIAEIAEGGIADVKNGRPTKRQAP